MFTLTRADGYQISTDPDRIDLDRVHAWLSTDAYWALGRERETVARAFAGSVGFGHSYYSIGGKFDNFTRSVF